MKKATTIPEQLKILKARGLIINDQEIDKAKKFLLNNNYYKITGYLYKYKIKGTEKLKSISFSELYDIYYFDKELRSSLLKILESIELSFKSYIAYIIANKYGPTGYLDSGNFQDSSKHRKFLSSIEGIKNQRKNKKRISHHINKYGEDLAIWVLVDIMTFRNVALLYANMLKEDKQEINKFLNNYISPKIVSKWLDSFSILRNDCAHSERLYYEHLRSIDIKTNVVKYKNTSIGVDKLDISAHVINKEKLKSVNIINNTL